MAGGDWIKIHRAVMDHPVFEDPLLWKVFSWCILKANYRAGSFRGIEVPVGSFVTGKLRAAEELSIPPTTWYRSMKRLSEPPFSCITLKADHGWTTVTVCNYTTYQNLASVGGPQVDHERTTSGPQVEPIEEEQEQQERKKGAVVSAAVAEFVAAWNATQGVRHIRDIGKRASTLSARLSSKAWDWKAALAKFPLKCFASDPDGFVPDLEFFLRPGTVTKILEGKYDWTKRGQQQRTLAIGAGQTFDPGAGTSDPNFGRMG